MVGYSTGVWCGGASLAGACGSGAEPQCGLGVLKIVPEGLHVTSCVPWLQDLSQCMTSVEFEGPKRLRLRVSASRMPPGCLAASAAYNRPATKKSPLQALCGALSCMRMPLALLG